MSREPERSAVGAPLDVPPRAPLYSTMWLFSLLAVLALIPLRAFLNRIVESDYLALAVATPDDSFYYLLPAWRFPTHGYFTFDGVHPTYGFQPLFMVLLTALSAVLPSIEDVFRAGLGVNAILHVASGVMVGLVVSTLLSECSAMVRYMASLLAGFVYLFGWNLFWINFTLKENSLATFLYLLAMFCLLRALSTRRERSIGSDVWLGTLIGLLILARLLPSSLLAAGVMLGVVWAWLARRSAIVISAAMLVPLVLWGIYAKLAFGHLLPSSDDGKGGWCGDPQRCRALAVRRAQGNVRVDRVVSRVGVFPLDRRGHYSFPQPRGVSCGWRECPGGMYGLRAVVVARPHHNGLVGRRVARRAPRYPHTRVWDYEESADIFHMVSL